MKLFSLIKHLIFFNQFSILGIGYWGLGIGDWQLPYRLGLPEAEDRRRGGVHSHTDKLQHRTDTALPRPLFGDRHQRAHTAGPETLCHQDSAQCVTTDLCRSAATTAGGQGAGLQGQRRGEEGRHRVGHKAGRGTAERGIPCASLLHYDSHPTGERDSESTDVRRQTVVEIRFGYLQKLL